MGRIIALLSRVDAAVQRRFDSACFFLMRRFGIRKSSIRYATNALIIAAFACGLAAEMRYGVASAFSIFVGSISIVIMLLAQHFAAHDDREAEARPGTVPVMDRKPDRGAWKLIAVIFLILTFPEFLYVPPKYAKVGLSEGQHLFPAFCDVLFWLSYLGWMYLQKTPMNPPPEEAREPASEPQTAPVES